MHAPTARVREVGSSDRVVQGDDSVDATLKMLQEAMEQVILNPQKYLKETRVNHFGSGVNDRFHSTTFERSILLTRLKGTEAGLARAQVWIEWEDGHKNFRLERYVRAD